VNAVVNFRENAGNLWSGFTTGGLYNSAQLHRVSYTNITFHVQNKF
jgi:hypothetical protein